MKRYNNLYSPKKKAFSSSKKQRTAWFGQLKEQEQSIASSTRSLRDTQRSLEMLKGNIDKLTRSIRQLQDRQGRAAEIAGTAVRRRFSSGAAFRTAIDPQ